MALMAAERAELEAIYRIAVGKMAEVFGDLDHRRLVEEG
jgi:hypothetical protein